MNKLAKYEFKAAYDKIDSEMLGTLRLTDVDVLISIVKLHLVEHPMEMQFFFEALRSSMEIYGVDRGKSEIDFFGKFDYSVHSTNTKLGDKCFDFRINFVFHSIMGYHTLVLVYFDFYGNFFVTSNKATTGWTDL